MKRFFAILLCLSLTACFAACGTPASEEPISGGWSTGDPTELTDDQKAVFDKAMEDYVGVEYTPLLYMGMQVVAGYNHRILCKAQAVTPDAEESYAIVEIYEDLEGGATVTNVYDVSDAEAAQYLG